MLDIELEQLRRNPSWKATLLTYWELQTEGRAGSAEFDGWVPRVMQVPDVETAKLSSVHGRLIAFGFLKFDLSNRDLGMRYQLTPLGKRAIGEADPTEPAELAESA
ncbi:MAG: hypothetical protein SH850_18590 [Planctomycetaceae bacterium]|nr:hypothetical protein [Planctomycetaceae bacterium]